MDFYLERCVCKTATHFFADSTHVLLLATNIIKHQKQIQTVFGQFCISFSICALNSSLFPFRGGGEGILLDFGVVLCFNDNWLHIKWTDIVVGIQRDILCASSPYRM